MTTPPRPDLSSARPRRWRPPLLLALALAPLLLLTRWASGGPSSPSAPAAPARDAEAVAASRPAAASPVPPRPEPSGSTPRPYAGALPSVVAASVEGASLEETPEAAAKFVRQAALEYRMGRDNVFFKEQDFLRDFTRGAGPRRIETLKRELLATRDLESLPPDVNFGQSAPGAAVERMAMLDMLAGIAREDRQAMSALVEVAQAPIDKALPAQVKRALVGDKYDAFVSLTRVDRQRAFTEFTHLESPGLKKLLLPALIGGLMDSGVAQDEAVRLTAALL